MKIQVNNISKRYKMNDKNIIALDNISIEFFENNFYTIMGHSGSGKSTFIHCLGLLDTIDTGSILYDNIDVSKMSETDKSNKRATDIGFVFQAFYLNQKLSALENVMLPMYINKNILPKERYDKAFALLKKVGLEDRINHFPKELSGGEQQRVAIARALANNPRIILADEPTGNLDVQTEREIFELLKELSKESKCIIVVSHNDIVKQYADKIFNMENGVLTEVKYDKTINNHKKYKKHF